MLKTSSTQGSALPSASLRSVGIPKAKVAASSLSAMNVPVHQQLPSACKRQWTEGGLADDGLRYLYQRWSWFGRFEMRTFKIMMSTVREESSLHLPPAMEPLEVTFESELPFMCIPMSS
jgi:hypothetical protein